VKRQKTDWVEATGEPLVFVSDEMNYATQRRPREVGTVGHAHAWMPLQRSNDWSPAGSGPKEFVFDTNTKTSSSFWETHLRLEKILIDDLA